MDLSGALAWLKLSPRYLLAICIGLGAVLFMPPNLLDTLGLVEFRESFKGFLGAGFILACALLGSGALINTTEWVRTWWRRRKNLQRCIDYLHQLTPEEAEILRGYVYHRTRTRTLPIESGVVQGLVAHKVIYRAASVGDMLDGWAYNLQPWAWDYLMTHPYLVLSPDESERFMAGDL